MHAIRPVGVAEPSRPPHSVRLLDRDLAPTIAASWQRSLQHGLRRADHALFNYSVSACASKRIAEANRTLHHLSAGYSRITTLIDNVLAFQRLDRGEDTLRRSPVALDDLVGAAVEGAVELIGPGRAQYAVHAPQDEVTVDGERLARALAHLVADVAGVDSAGNATAHSGDSTIVVAAALRGESVRVDVRGPSAGGDPVHLPALLTGALGVASTSEARRLIAQGGVKVNGEPAAAVDLPRADLAGALLQVGKRRFARLTAA